MQTSSNRDQRKHEGCDVITSALRFESFYIFEHFIYNDLQVICELNMTLSNCGFWDLLRSPTVTFDSVNA